MGFWKKHWAKITADTVSGILGRLIAPILLGLGGVYAGSKIVSSPIDKDIIIGILWIIGVILFLLTVAFFLYLPLILEWLSWMRESKTRALELENENLKLQLEFRQQEQESQRDEGE